MLVGDLMSRPLITSSPTAMVSEALHGMQEADIRHLPVVDRAGRLTGVRSERDAYRGLLQSRDLSITVGSMPETLASEATALMLDHKIGVVDEDMHLIGVVTETDFLRLAHDRLGGAALVDSNRSSA